MNEIGKNIAKGLFYLVATVLIVWTSSLTVTFVQSALPNTFFLVPYLALVVFDGGMIAWLFVFLRYAQGAGQRATAIVTCLADFLGVGLMVIAEILLGGQTLAAAPENLGTYAIWGIGVWTVVNVLSVLVFHITDPEAIKQMSLQNEKDEIWRGALKQLASMRAQNSSRLHEEIGRRLYNDMLAELDVNGNGVPDKLEEKPTVTPAPKRPPNAEWVNELSNPRPKQQTPVAMPSQNGRSNNIETFNDGRFE